VGLQSRPDFDIPGSRHHLVSANSLIEPLSKLHQIRRQRIIYFSERRNKDLNRDLVKRNIQYPHLNPIHILIARSSDGIYKMPYLKLLSP